VIEEEFLLQFRDVLPPADIPIDSMSAAQCLDVIADAEKMTAHFDAQAALAMARFAELRPPSRRGVDLADGAREEVSMELGISPRAAASQIRQARELVTRLPETLAALADGRIDASRAVTMTDLTSVLSEEDARVVERRVLQRGRRLTPGKFKDAIRNHMSKVDADAADRHREAAQSRRDVSYFPCFDGMGQLAAELTEEETNVARGRIEHLAELACTPGNSRSPDQVRADVLVALIFDGQTERSEVTINATVSTRTLKVLNQHPDELFGYDSVMAERALELVADTRWRLLITDPTGHVPQTTDRRAASPALTRYIHIRDRTCRVPGCSAPAVTSEIDHTIRRTDDGLTSPDNTGAYCKFHNLWKERSQWTVTQPTPGTFTFTSPEGRVYTTQPEPYEEPSHPHTYEPTVT
jgi:hypothetical protein